MENAPRRSVSPEVTALPPPVVPGPWLSGAKRAGSGPGGGGSRLPTGRGARAETQLAAREGRGMFVEGVEDRVSGRSRRESAGDGRRLHVGEDRSDDRAARSRAALDLDGRAARSHTDQARERERGGGIAGSEVCSRGGRSALQSARPVGTTATVETKRSATIVTGACGTSPLERGFPAHRKGTSAACGRSRWTLDTTASAGGRAVATAARTTLAPPPAPQHACTARPSR